MSTIFFCSIILSLGSLGCLTEEIKRNEHPIKFSIELPDTIYKERLDIPIFFKIENTTSEILSVRNPSRWGNVFPTIEQKGKNYVSVKINPFEPHKDIIQIRENETIRIEFDYRLDKIFNLEFNLPGKYDIHFKYYYEPKKDKKRQFIDEIFIMSDVFTFCVQ